MAVLSVEMKAVTTAVMKASRLADLMTAQTAQPKAVKSVVWMDDKTAVH